MNGTGEQEGAGEEDERGRSRAQVAAVVAVGARDVSCLELQYVFFLFLYSLFTKIIIYRITNNNDDYYDHLHDQHQRARDRVRELEGDERFQLTSRGMQCLVFFGPKFCI